MKNSEKQKLRQHYKAKRNQLSYGEIETLSASIQQVLFANFDFRAKTVHTFYTIKEQKEIAMRSINTALLEQARQVATSITCYNTNPLHLTHSLVTKQTIFTPDKYHIPVPQTIFPVDEKEIDIVLVPLLICDTFGNRIGYGKGLYDSFLIKCKKECIKIGLSLFEPLNRPLPYQPHDVKLDYCITPHNIYKKNNKKTTY